MGFKYMHTLDGEPAYFDGKQVVYHCGRKALPLVEDAEQLRAEQQQSRRWRKKNNYPDIIRYGRVKVEA